MSGVKDQHKLDDMRKRLYSRGTEGSSPVGGHLSDKEIDVARNWNSPARPDRPAPVVEAPAVASPSIAAPQNHAAPIYANDTLSVIEAEDVAVPQYNKPRRYRKIVLLTSIGLLALGVALAAAFVFFGGKRISADNINFNIEGPNTIGSSETLSFQVAVTNQNTVAIENATLVLRYPEGTRTVSDPIKNVYEDRIAVGTLQPGEAKNVPIQVAVFGKENDIKEIKATFEYRVIDSDGMFYKEAPPLKFQIISSPITLLVSSIGKVAAGQPVEVTLTVKSNTNKELKDVLISAAYPNGFAYSQSDPKPFYNQNVWKIDTLKPEQSTKIKIKGVISGLTEEKFGINFSAGVANTENQYMVGSLLAEARTEFVIETPFLAVDISIGGDSDGSVVLQAYKAASFDIIVKNTLSEAVYDAVVEVVPKGNAFSAESVDSSEGYYDSNKNVIRWESANTPSLAQIPPGETRKLNFSLQPIKNLGTAALDVTVNVYARRVGEPSAQEQLIGTVSATARYATEATLSAGATHMTGPVPPKVGQTTRYLLTLVAEAGGNNMTNTVITTSFPSYVNWLDEYSGPGTVDYNPVTRELAWRAGDVNTGMKRELSIAVSIVPSLSQVGSIPLLLNQQQLTATDRFTNTAVKAVSDSVSTELAEEGGFAKGNGKVEN